MGTAPMGQYGFCYLNTPYYFKVFEKVLPSPKSSVFQKSGIGSVYHAVIVCVTVRD